MNIVYITADQLGAAFVGCYGSGVNSTPTLDQMAAEGIRFSRCYATHPVCAPNRSTMLTGRCDEVTGITENNLVLQEDIPTIAHVLHQAGFYTGGFGKFHQTPMHFPLPPDFHYLGFDECALTEDPKLGRWLDAVREEKPEKFPKALAVCWKMPYMSWYGAGREDLTAVYEKAEARYLESQKIYTYPYMYTSPLPKELHQTTWITDQALDFMDRNRSKPFYCNISYVDPHDPYDPPKPYDTMFRPEDIPEPIARDWQRGSVFDNPGVHPPYFEEDPSCIQKLRALYHGSIRFVDDQIGRIIEFLKESGLWKDTVVIFTTDHGDMMLDHEMLRKGAMHYDTATRCPLIVAGGAIHPREKVSERLTCTLDFCPTICDLAHVLDRPLYEGKSFAGRLDSRIPAVITAQYTAWPDGRHLVEEIPDFVRRFQLKPGDIRVTQTQYETDGTWQEITVQSNRCLRSIFTDEGYRLTIYSDGAAGELFDLRHDPLEQHNLYEEPAYAQLKLKLLERHIRAFTERTAVPQYRNLMYLNGQKWLDGQWFEYFPTFTLDRDRIPK